MLCCGYTLTDLPISIRLTSLALWQSNDCPSASKATLMNTDKYFMWIHYERLHNHNKAKHNKTVCIFLEIYCTWKRISKYNSFLALPKWLLILLTLQCHHTNNVFKVIVRKVYLYARSRFTRLSSLWRTVMANKPLSVRNNFMYIFPVIFAVQGGGQFRANVEVMCVCKYMYVYQKY